jgi:toxin ParE1/3/4
MGKRVIISPAARVDLKAIVEYIAQDNPKVAISFGNKLIVHALSLATHSLRGRVLDSEEAPNVRYLVFKSYLIIYEVDEINAAVTIHRFWHGARGEPKLTDEG